MKKYPTSVLLGSLLFAGAASAQQTAFLDFAPSGSYLDGAESVTTSIVNVDGGTFDLTYTIGVIANPHLTDPGANPSLATSTGTVYGVSGGNDIVNHIATLEGNDGEGLSFTSLTLSNFVAGTTYTQAEIENSLIWSGISFSAVANANDGVNISFTSFGDAGATNQLLNAGSTGGTPYLHDLTTIAGNDTADSVYLEVDSGQSNNRWAIDGLQVSYVPEPSSYALLAGLLSLSFGMLRRRQA